ncbi:unnamed protein product [Prunus armeniaca]|uniref:Uncharacterized protein n=1 Tax=Prunus armeniaca TaxID=36596 RepID=A0A6J5WEC3_PRUAR|nr:unnamed protein product [Prunus armeniaca]CAB4298721.1 unnamed protein product [Prunus armeniaca]
MAKTSNVSSFQNLLNRNQAQLNTQQNKHPQTTLVVEQRERKPRISPSPRTCGGLADRHPLAELGKRTTATRSSHQGPSSNSSQTARTQLTETSNSNSNSQLCQSCDQMNPNSRKIEGPTHRTLPKPPRAAKATFQPCQFSYRATLPNGRRGATPDPRMNTLIRSFGMTLQDF